MLRLLRTTLPETLETKIKRFKTKLKLPENLISQILKSEYLELFENITKSYKVKPTLIATTFISCLKDLRRKGVAIEAIRDEHFYQLFDALQTHEVVKEAIPDVLTYLAKKPEKNVKQAIADLNLKPLGPIELKNIVRETWKKFPHLPKEKVFGLIMSKVRGKANVEDVKKTLEELR
jgi:glutamyl-tRNA(Gln) amidotransferase subunit E